MNNNSFIRMLIERSPEFVRLESPLIQCTEMLERCVRSGGKILTCGNGGSAADAEHIVGELMKGFLLPRELQANQKIAFEKMYSDTGIELASNLQQAIPAISLVASVSLATAFANDVSADYVFAQQVFGLAKEGDVLWGMTTSGNSKNVIHAFRVARALKVKTLGFTGGCGGGLSSLCDVEIRAPHTSTPIIQEMHLQLYHTVCAELEAQLFKNQRE